MYVSEFLNKEDQRCDLNPRHERSTISSCLREGRREAPGTKGSS